MGGAGVGGICQLNPGFNGVQYTAAINDEQYEGGRACGRCIMLTGTGEGTGKSLCDAVSGFVEIHSL